MGRTFRRPDLLQIVELANLRPEQVDDDVPGIDQHPVCTGHALDAGGTAGSLLDLPRDMVCQGRHMAPGPARSNQHEVCQ